MKVADAVAAWIASKSIRHVFTVSGGADLHLIHSIWKRKDLKLVCPQSEAAAGFAADAYSRLNGFGVALATSGPGAQNFCTPLATSFVDSVPVLFLTGNQTVERMKDYGTRGYGFQAGPIAEMFRLRAKYAVTVNHPREVMMHLEAAYKIAKGMRPGPVLVDLPDCVQRASI